MLTWFYRRRKQQTSQQTLRPISQQKDTYKEWRTLSNIVQKERIATERLLKQLVVLEKEVELSSLIVWLKKL